MSNQITKLISEFAAKRDINAIHVTTIRSVIADPNDRQYGLGAEIGACMTKYCELNEKWEFDCLKGVMSRVDLSLDS